MGRIAKIAIALLLSASVQSQDVLQGRDGLWYLVNNHQFYISCDINTNAGRATWGLYPGQSSGGYRWISIVECW